MKTTRRPPPRPVERYEHTPRRRLDDRWHVGKEIPIVFIAAVLLQTAGVIWWVSQLSSKIDNVIGAVAEFKAERYTREDATRARELIEQKFEQERGVDRELDRRITSLETKMERITRP